jgi:hypothetical protein
MRGRSPSVFEAWFVSAAHDDAVRCREFSEARGGGAGGG